MLRIIIGEFRVPRTRTFPLKSPYHLPAPLNPPLWQLDTPKGGRKKEPPFNPILPQPALSRRREWKSSCEATRSTNQKGARDELEQRNSTNRSKKKTPLWRKREWDGFPITPLCWVEMDKDDSSALRLLSSGLLLPLLFFFSLNLRE